MKQVMMAVVCGFFVGLMLSHTPSVAHAEDLMVGKIDGHDGGSACNWSTGYGLAGCTQGDSCVQSFALPSGNKLISVVCDAPCYVTVSRTGVDAGIGVPLATNEKLYTDTGKNVTATKPDGGVYTGGSVCVTGGVGTVFSRNGLE